MNYEYNKYVDIINKYKKGEIKLERFRVFEYLVAIEMKMLMWDDAVKIIENYSQISGYSDTGIDLVNPDLTKTVQVKSGYKNSGGVTYDKITSYVALSFKLLNVEEHILVVETETVVNYRARILLSDIIRYNFDELLNNLPNTTVPKIVCAYTPPDKLTPEEKVDEFYEYVKNNGLPKSGMMFSDGSRLYSYLNSYRSSRRFNFPMYDKLYSLDKLKNYYGDIYKSKKDEETQVKQLTKYYHSHGLEYVLELNIWKECKRLKMMHTSETLTDLLLLDGLEEDYEEYIRQHHPDDYIHVKEIINLVKFVNSLKERKGILKYDFWVKCKKDETFNLWPYMKFLDVKEYYDDAWK